MEYDRLLSSILSLSKLHSIYQYKNEYLHPLVISASERLANEEITGNHLALLCQSLYYSKLFSQDLMQLILPISDHFLGERALSPENINSIYGYISLYPNSHEYVLKSVPIFKEFISRSLVDARNIIKYLKIGRNKNDISLKRISANLVAASVDQLTANELLDVLLLYTYRDYSSVGVLGVLTHKLDWIIDNIGSAHLPGLLYYISKLYVLQNNEMLFKRHLHMAIAKSIVNVYNAVLDVYKLVNYVKILNRIGGNSKFISTSNNVIKEIIKNSR